MMQSMHSRKVAANYGAVMVETGVATADRVQLVLLLLDGLLESLNAAEGHIKANAIQEKSRHLNRAGRIVIGLQGSLDFEKGGDLARNLAELYGYITRRLLQINMKNDLVALSEVKGLMMQIRDAWQTVPSLIPVPAQ
jgi:flagellar protein FliS